MADHGIDLDGWEETSSRIRRIAATGDLGYLAANDRTDRRNEVFLDRFDFDEQSARTWLRSQPEGETEPPAWRADELPLPAEAVTEIALRWLHNVAANAALDREGWVRVRVMLWMPNGAKSLGTPAFLVRRRVVEDDYGDPLPQAASPRSEAEDALFLSYSHLGQAWRDFGRAVLEVRVADARLESKAAELREREQERYGRRLDVAHDQIDQLVGRITEVRREHAEGIAQQEVEERRMVIAENAMKTAEAAFETYMRSKGLSPQMARTLAIVEQHDAFRGALEDPQVQALLADKSTLDFLAGMLRETAAANAAASPAAPAEGAADATSNPSASPPPASAPSAPADASAA